MRKTRFALLALLLGTSAAHAGIAARSTLGVHLDVTADVETSFIDGVVFCAGASVRLHAGAFVFSASLLVWPEFFQANGVGVGHVNGPEKNSPRRVNAREGFPLPTSWRRRAPWRWAT